MIERSLFSIFPLFITFAFLGICVGVIIIIYVVTKHFSNQLKNINKTLVEIKEQNEKNEDKRKISKDK
jgi:predicted membrane protein